MSTSNEGSAGEEPHGSEVAQPTPPASPSTTAATSAPQEANKEATPAAADDDGDDATTPTTPAATEPELQRDDGSDEANGGGGGGGDAPVALKVIYNKRKIDLTFSTSEKVIALKRRLQEVTGVPVDMQKLMFRGLCHDDRVLAELGIGRGAKLMLVGSTPDSLASVRRSEDDAAAAAVGKGTTSRVASGGASSAGAASAASAAAASGGGVGGGERLSQRDSHKRVLDKYGRPDDLMPALASVHLPLPPAPLSGMYNRQGVRVRLTFKLEIDELWIGTKERTNKIPMSSIKRVVSDAIDGQEGHHILGLQLGTTEQSMYWIYWVPCQYVRAIRNTIGTS